MEQIVMTNTDEPTVQAVDTDKPAQTIEQRQPYLSPAVVSGPIFERQVLSSGCTPDEEEECPAPQC